jgi:uncharacterized protein (TIGR00730 family)
MSNSLKVKVHELNVKEESKKNNFRVAIFGSARIKKGEKAYKQVYNLAKEIGLNGYDIVTGGGPGLMEAANAGHIAGDKSEKVESIGLNIKLDFEQSINEYVELKKEFERFAERLETFVLLSNVFVITPGGIGTMLEFFYTWQLAQVKKIEFKPIILVGEMWRRLIYWVIDYSLKDGLLSSSDFDYIYIAKNNKEALKMIKAFHKQFAETGKCWPIDKDKFKALS